MCVLCCAVLVSGVGLFVTRWTVTSQTPLSIGILQARILEWVAISSSRGSSQLRDWTQVSHIAGDFFTIWATWEAIMGKTKSRGKCGESPSSQVQLSLPTQRDFYHSQLWRLWKKVKVKSLSCVLLFATPWIAALEAPLSMGFSRPLEALGWYNWWVLLFSFVIVQALKMVEF